MGLFLQDFKPFKRLIMNLIDLTFELFYDQSNSDMADTLQRNNDKIRDIYTKWILNYCRASWAFWVEIIMRLQPWQLLLLTSVLQSLCSSSSLLLKSNACSQSITEGKMYWLRNYRISGICESSIEMWAKKIRQGKAAYEELFILTDQEGEGKRLISKTEFKTIAGFK